MSGQQFIAYSLMMFLQILRSISQNIPFFAQSRTDILFRHSYTDQFNSVTKSKCLSRISVPHFMTESYTMPESTFHSPAECEDIANLDNASNPDTIFGGEDSEQSKYRLPKNIKPVHYTLKLCPNLEIPFDFVGSVKIDLQILKPTTNITLNSVGLQLLSAVVWETTKIKNINKKPIKFRNRGKYIDYIIPNENVNDKQTLVYIDEFSGNNTENVEKLKSLLKTINIENVKYKQEIIEELFIENDESISYIGITDVIENGDTQQITFITTKELEVGRTYSIKIAYKGDLRNDVFGFYLINYLNKNGDRRWGAATQFQISEARTAFPSFDEPSFKAKFSISICREQHMTAISNMPRVQTTVKKEYGIRRFWDVFETSVPMSTYLVAFAVFEFDHVNCTDSEKPIKVWLPSNYLAHANFTCEVAPKILDFFENYFDIEYPLSKMDLVGLPQFAAYGMENWGIITFGLDIVAIEDISKDSIAARNGLETIGHEIAHQWFGNLVTPHWWSDIWLNEGFASYLSILSSDAVRPQWYKLKEDIVNVQQEVMIEDSFESSHSIVINVERPEQSIFDQISYGKGSFVIRMLVHMISEKTFQRGTRKFLQLFKYKSATQENLWKILTEVGHEDKTLPVGMTISKIMNSWLYQEGFPVVTITRLQNGSAILSQKRCYYEVDEELQDVFTRNESGVDSPKWWIPLSFTTQKIANMFATNPKYWITSDQEEILLNELPPKNEWYLVNMQQTGFFRVNYDIDNWRLLAKQLIDNHLVFDDITRSQLVNDAFILAYSGQLPFEIILTMVEYLSKEESIYVIVSASEIAVPILKSMWHLFNYGDLKNLFMKAFEHHMPSPCFTSHSYETPFTKAVKLKLVKHFSFIHKPCIEEAKQLFNQWITHKANYSFVQPSEYLPAIFCIIVHEGDEEEWNILWEEFNSKRYSFTDEIFIGALSCTRNRWLLSKLLFKFSSSKDIGNLITAVHTVSNTPTGMDLAWDFMNEIWTQISSSYYADMFLEAIIPRIRNHRHLKKVLSLIEESAIAGTLDYSQLNYLTEMCKNVQRKIQFYGRSIPQFANWFEEHQYKKQSYIFTRNNNK